MFNLLNFPHNLQEMLEESENDKQLSSAQKIESEEPNRRQDAQKKETVIQTPPKSSKLKHSKSLE